jgi:hypothetical protein
MRRPISPSGLKYVFTGIVWKYEGVRGWHFISLPAALSTQIRSAIRSEEEGWGRLPARAAIAETTWQTAIWFDTKAGAYLLPLKGDIRKKENIFAGQEIRVTIWI